MVTSSWSATEENDVAQSVGTLQIHGQRSAMAGLATFLILRSLHADASYTLHFVQHRVLVRPMQATVGISVIIYKILPLEGQLLKQFASYHATPFQAQFRSILPRTCTILLQSMRSQP